MWSHHELSNMNMKNEIIGKENLIPLAFAVIFILPAIFAHGLNRLNYIFVVGIIGFLVGREVFNYLNGNYVSDRNLSKSHLLTSHIIIIYLVSYIFLFVI